MTKGHYVSHLPVRPYVRPSLWPNVRPFFYFLMQLFVCQWTEIYKTYSTCLGSWACIRVFLLQVISLRYYHLYWLYKVKSLSSFFSYNTRQKFTILSRSNCLSMWLCWDYLLPISVSCYVYFCLLYRINILVNVNRFCFCLNTVFSSTTFCSDSWHYNRDLQIILTLVTVPLKHFNIGHNFLYGDKFSTYLHTKFFLTYILQWRNPLWRP